MIDPPPRSEVSILLVGDTDRSEFRPARAAMEASAHVFAVPDAESAVDALSRRQVVPDLIVVAQAYPAQFAHRAIDRLRRLAPLARVLGLLGSWCEGEMRTGKPWPAAIRLYWHQWLPRCEIELGRMRRNECSAWGLPITATEEERLLLGAETPTAKRQGLIAIHAWRFEMADWLSAACRLCGCSTVWLRPSRSARVEGATAAIFDGSDGRKKEVDQLRRLARVLHPAPTIALLDFPRIEDRRRALAAGAAAVISKPLQLNDLSWALDQIAADTASGVQC